MDRFLIWAADSPLASALRVAGAAGLVHLLDNIAGLGLSVPVQVALTAAIPVLLRALNPEDGAFGRQVGQQWPTHH